jgi:hypothetical protein
MQAPRFANAPGLQGSTYGFRERRANGLRTLQHTGDWGGFASKLFLIPSQDLGLFVCSNSDDATLREQIVGLFLDEYFPQTATLGSVPEPPGFAARAAPLTGTYRGTRYAHDTFEKIYELSSTNEVIVETLGDALNVDGVRYVEVEPLLFRRSEQDEYVAFGSGPRGVEYLFQDAAAFEHLEWYETHRFNRRLLIGIVTVLLLALADAATGGRRPVRPTRPAMDGRPAGGPRLDGAARLLAGLVAGLDLLFLAALGLSLETVDIVYGVPGWLAALLTLPLAATALTAALAVMCVIVWARHALGLAARLQYVLTTTAALAFIWFCAYWNLLGWNY